MSSDVLILVQYYLPGFKSGGPIRSIQALVELLGDGSEIQIVTYDRDSGDLLPYRGIRTQEWQKLDESEVYYVCRTRWVLWNLFKVLRETESETLYLQSLFNPKFSIFPLLLRRLGLVKFRRVLVAPRGELSEGALSLKPFRKKLFLAVARKVGLIRGCEWHATSEIEKREIHCLLQLSPECNSVKVHVAQNLVPSALTGLDSLVSMSTETSRAESLRVVFLSRIAPKKNLHYAIEVLRRCTVPIIFSIYGPVDRDPHYWEQCQRMIEELPEHIDVRYEGAIKPSRIPAMFKEQDLLLFPTLGENFGHVIVESLLSGCPVLISDRTPWRNLEFDKVGWDFPLDSPQRFVEVIEEYSRTPVEDRIEFRQHASNFASQRVNTRDMIKANRKMLFGDEQYVD